MLGYDHIAPNYPTKRSRILNPKREVEIEHSSPSPPKSSSSHTSSPSSNEVKIKPNEGGLLVVRCMLGQVQKDLESQRENTFHSRCLINNKLCSLIIDSGSCVNVASTRVVDKLGLKTFLMPSLERTLLLAPHKEACRQALQELHSMHESQI